MEEVIAAFRSSFASTFGYEFKVATVDSLVKEAL